MPSLPLSPPPSPRTLACGGLGGGLLLLSLAPTLALEQGNTAAHAAVFLLLCLLASGAFAAVLYSTRRMESALQALLPIGLAFLLRAAMLDHQSADYMDFLSRWVETFRQNGGFAAIKQPIGNYNAPYLYFLAAFSYLPLSDLYLIKLLSITFDVILAWGGLRLVRRLRPEELRRQTACFCVLLLLPTAVLNGACWGQCDSLYGGLVLHALADALDGRGKRSCALLGLAFSFKLQTIFLIPLWGGLWLAKRLKFPDLFFFPIGYGAAILPAVLMGKPLADILGVYLGQTAEGAGHLCYNAPSAYSFLPYGAQPDERTLSLLGIAAAFVLVLLLLGALFLRRGRAEDRLVLAAAAVMAIGVPFLLPYMHDRYFFLADVLCAAWACAFSGEIPCALLVQGSSLMSYLNYLRGRYTLVLSLGGQTYVMLTETLLMLCALIWALSSLFAQLRPSTGLSAQLGKDS